MVEYIMPDPETQKQIRDEHMRIVRQRCDEQYPLYYDNDSSGFVGFTILVVTNGINKKIVLDLQGHELTGNEQSVQKPCACKTKSFFKAVTLSSDFSTRALIVTVCYML